MELSTESRELALRVMKTIASDLDDIEAALIKIEESSEYNYPWVKSIITERTGGIDLETVRSVLGAFIKAING